MTDSRYMKPLSAVAQAHIAELRGLLEAGRDLSEMSPEAARWLASRRRYEKQGRASIIPAILDEQVPGWRTAYRRREGYMPWQASKETAAQVAAFISREGRWPRQRDRNVPEDEGRLGTWLSNQRVRSRPGADCPLAEKSRELFNEVIPGWDAPRINTRAVRARPAQPPECRVEGCTSKPVARHLCKVHYGRDYARRTATIAPTTRRTFQMLTLAVEHMKTHDALSDDAPVELREWLKYRRRDAKNRTAPADMDRLLDALDPTWRLPQRRRLS